MRCRSHSPERVSEMVTYRTVDEKRRGRLCFALFCFVFSVVFVFVFGVVRGLCEIKRVGKLFFFH